MLRQEEYCLHRAFCEQECRNQSAEQKWVQKGWCFRLWKAFSVNGRSLHLIFLAVKEMLPGGLTAYAIHAQLTRQWWWCTRASLVDWSLQEVPAQEASMEIKLLYASYENTGWTASTSNLWRKILWYHLYLIRIRTYFKTYYDISKHLKVNLVFAQHR
jgi:hypothetical protein